MESLLFLVAWIGLATVSDERVPAEPERFGSRGQVLDGPAEWVSFDTDLAVFGSGKHVTVAAVRPDLHTKSRFLIESPANQGILAGRSLYLIEVLERSQRLGVLSLDHPGAAPVPVRLTPEPHGLLHIGQMDDYLLLAEDDRGLRILEFPGHRHHGTASHAPEDSLSQVGFFPLREQITAVAASLRTVYVATEQDVVVLDATTPAAPGFVRRVPIEAEVHALAANGSTVYLLGDDGLRILDLSRPDGVPAMDLHPDVRGRSMFLAGRTVYVADGGFREFRDQSATAATIFVSVGDVFFSPAGVVNVNVGDTVQWQKPSTVFTHNVFSCNPAQLGCSGASSTQAFSSGPVTTSSFNFSFTFTLSGNNPYLCQSHTASMRGDIQVSGGPGPPPGVPDGTGAAAPMTANKLDATATDLAIGYDPGCPDAQGHDIVFSTGAQLPSSLGGTYGLTGGRCGIGTTSPFTWTLSPAPAAGQFVWWLIVADDGTSTEGSWGKDSGGNERTGPGLNGASGQCANTDKDLTNVCGQ